MLNKKWRNLNKNEIKNYYIIRKKYSKKWIKFFLNPNLSQKMNFS